MSKSDESMDDDAKYQNEEEIDDEESIEDQDLDDDDVDDDEDDDDDEEEENHNEDKDFEEKLNFLKNSIEENKYVYQNYIDIIQLTRNHGDLNNLRIYREKMSEMFPLTENLWLDWLSDEQKFIESSKDRERVYELFEKAIEDYLSINIWIEYIQFSIGGLGEPNGMEKIRSICERAVSIGGYHVKKGYTLWETYREFENAILAGLQQSLGGTTNSKKIEDDINEQTNLIVNLLKRQLRVSLEDMEGTLEELKQIDEKHVDEECLKYYQLAVEKLKELETYENAILNSATDEEKLQNYKNYLKHELKSNEKSNSNEPSIQCLFERAIADGSNCLDSSLWVMYTDYINEHSKSEDDQKMLLKIYKRALRNSPWTGKLWINYALCLEYNEAPSAEIKKAFNDGMNAGLQTSAEYLEIWHAYLDFLRRSLYDNKEKKTVTDEEIENLRDTFQRAINQLYEFFKHEGDPTLSLEKYWAYVEAKYFKNMEKARKIYNEMIIQRGMGQFASEWIEFYEFEIEFGEEKHQRKVLIRGLNEAIDSKERLCELLLRFEKQNGSIDSYVAAKLKCDKILQQINEENQKYYQEEEEKQKQNKNKKGNKKESQQPQQQQKQQKQKQQQQQPQDKVQNKEAENKNLKRKKSEEEVPQSNNGTKVDSDGFAVPSLPVSTSIQPAAKKAKSKDETNAETKQLPLVSAAAFDGTKKTSNNTVFLSNLSYDVKKEHIEAVFKDQLGFKGVRLVEHWSGKTKGFGYADFETQQQAISALKLDRTPVNGRPMFISQFEDKSLKLGGSTFKYSTHLEKSKLFVSNLPFSVDKPQLEKIFGAFGKLKDVRIVTYRSGKSKGLAYIDYEDEASATKAILQTDNMLIGENQISVAISNPPKRGQKDEGEKANPIVSSLGSGNVKTSAKLRGKGQMIDFVPRSISIKSSKSEAMHVDKDETTTTSKQLKDIQLEDKTGEVKNKPMSNEDFRSFLLKK